jgi:hypothetical protein
MLAFKFQKLIFLVLTVFILGCSGEDSGGGGGITADNGSTVVVGNCNNTGNAALGGSTQNNTACAAQQEIAQLAQSCRTCCDLCEGSAGVDGICRQGCVDDLGCADVIDKAPQCAAVTDTDNTIDDEPFDQGNLPGIINPAVS